MLMSDFNAILTHSLSPITLVSGVGLSMICMTARYNHATARIRQLIARRNANLVAAERDIDYEIALIFKRAALLRRGTFLISLSVIFAVLLVCLTVLQSFIGINLSVLSAVFLMCAVLLLIGSSIYFCREIYISLHALGQVIKHLPQDPENSLDQAKSQ